MNRKTLLLSLVMFLSVCSVHAARPTTGLVGRLLQRYTPLIAKFTGKNIGIAVVVAGLGYYGFNMLRNWMIGQKIKYLIEQAKQVIKQSGSDCCVINASETKVWGKGLGISSIKIMRQKQKIEVELLFK
jgi:hypothetical protein